MKDPLHGFTLVKSIAYYLSYVFDFLLQDIQLEEYLQALSRIRPPTREISVNTENGNSILIIFNLPYCYAMLIKLNLRRLVFDLSVHECC